MKTMLRKRAESVDGLLKVRSSGRYFEIKRSKKSILKEEFNRSRFSGEPANPK